MSEEQLAERKVDLVDISYDEVSARHYNIEEDLKTWRSEKTSRGPLEADWIKSNMQPMMCSYKHVSVSFEVWGLQGRVEDYVHRTIREVLLVGHRQAVAWLDQWIGMDESDVRRYEKEMYEITNEKVTNVDPTAGTPTSTSDTVVDGEDVTQEVSTPKRGWFSWS